MKILLLGANGMLGHALADVFVEEDLVLGDLPDYDITNYDDLNLKIDQIKPEVIINAAAYTNVDGCETDKELCLSVNGLAMGNLAAAAKKQQAVLIHYSTDYVFDGDNKDGYAEDEPINPVNAYGVSKAKGEELIRQSGCNFYLIRTAWLYGKYGKNFVDTIIDLSVKQEEIKVVNDQFGNPTYAPDLAKATRQLMIDKKPFGVYHQTNANNCSWYDFALRIKEIKGFEAVITPVSSAEFPRPAKRPNYSILINTKLTPLRSWQEALVEYLKK
ncbi:MAG: dTDP-4-dehydrorhamnose reductase [Candidatus Komeilibacteria bacterium]|nr:dTDP-4-dehydrorhamnose reductase [Candidatus Komeilibacteria bacterium]